MAATLSAQRQTGSFYTEQSIAKYMVDWAIRSPCDHILEPSFGDGVFIEASAQRIRKLGNKSPNITAVELKEDTFRRFGNKGIDITAYHDDYLGVTLHDNVDVVIGNPPYVSLKHLPEDQKRNALNILSNHDIAAPLNGSLWLPFVLHSVDSLNDGGRLAFVLPFEITYVKYAFEMWNFLAERFGQLTVVRLYEDFFPDVDVETILLLAEDKGKQTASVEYIIYESIYNMCLNIAMSTNTVKIVDITQNKKPFISSLITNAQKSNANIIFFSDEILTPLVDVCKFKIGYVSADKAFFHPNESTVKKYNLSSNSLVPCIQNGKQINGGTGIGVFVDEGLCASKLYLPLSPNDQDKEYIKHGEELGVSKKYKCSHRNPWYITPTVEIPDVILTVFGDLPKLVINSGGYAVSNSLLCGTLKGITAKELVARWYNSLTLLSIELSAHSLGGGSFVIIPGEADQLKIVRPLPEANVDDISSSINKCICDRSISEAYKLGDELVLQNILGLTQLQIFQIRSAIETLRKWRLPHNRRHK